MTILDKEKETISKKKKKVNKNQDKDLNIKTKQKKKQPTWFYKLLSFFMIIFTVIALGVVIYNEIFSIAFMLPIILVSIVVLFGISFILNKTRLRKWIKNTSSVICLSIIWVLPFIYLFLQSFTNRYDPGFLIPQAGTWTFENYTNLFTSTV